MHYNDKEAVENNILEVVIYKHADLTKSHKFYYQVTSIQNCKYVRVGLLFWFLKNPDKFFKKLPEFKLLKEENWYYVVLKGDGNGNLIVENVTNVTDSENDFHRLH
jgi:hypothetical protein